MRLEPLFRLGLSVAVWALEYWFGEHRRVALIVMVVRVVDVVVVVHLDQL